MKEAQILQGRQGVQDVRVEWLNGYQHNQK